MPSVPKAVTDRRPADRTSFRLHSNVAVLGIVIVLHYAFIQRLNGKHMAAVGELKKELRLVELGILFEQDRVFFLGAARRAQGGTIFTAHSLTLTECEKDLKECVWSSIPGGHI